MFYHDLENDKLGGFIEECKYDGKYMLRKQPYFSCYNNADDNTLCMSMILKSDVITEKEYNTAYNLVESMTDENKWLFNEQDKENNNSEKIVTEIVYA